MQRAWKFKRPLHHSWHPRRKISIMGLSKDHHHSVIDCGVHDWSSGSLNHGRGLKWSSFTHEAGMRKCQMFIGPQRLITTWGHKCVSSNEHVLLESNKDMDSSDGDLLGKGHDIHPSSSANHTDDVLDEDSTSNCMDDVADEDPMAKDASFLPCLFDDKSHTQLHDGMNKDSPFFDDKNNIDEDSSLPCLFEDKSDIDEDSSLPCLFEDKSDADVDESVEKDLPLPCLFDDQNNTEIDVENRHEVGISEESKEETKDAIFESDFYEVVNMFHEAGEPIMARSLLDLAVEDIAQERNEQGHSLWQKFKSVASETSSFDCKSVIEAWLGEGNMVSRPALLHTILAFRSYRSQKKNKRALEIYNWVVAEKVFEFTDMDHAIYMDLIGKINGAKAASEYYTKISKSNQNPMIYSVLLAAFVESNMEKAAERLLARTRITCLKERVFLYNQMLAFYRATGKIVKVANLLKEMEDFSVSADLCTYNLILDLRARTGDVDGMLKVWKCLEQEDVRPDAASYATLVRGYLTAGLRQKAESAIKYIEMSPYRRKVVVYRWLLKLYAELYREDDLYRVWGLLTSIKKPRMDDYSIYIQSLGKAGKVRRAESMFKEMVKKMGVKRMLQYHALFSVYVNNDMFDKAESLAEKMMKTRFNPGPATYHRLIEMYVKIGDNKKALEMLGKAEKAGKIFQGHRPRYDSYLTILDMLAKKGDVENAELIMKDLKDGKYPRGFRVYSALLKAYIKADESPDGFLDRMRADGVIPNSHIRRELSKVRGT